MRSGRFNEVGMIIDLIVLEAVKLLLPCICEVHLYTHMYISNTETNPSPNRGSKVTRADNVNIAIPLFFPSES